MFASSHGKPMMMKSKDAVQHELGVQRSRQAERLGFHRTKLRAAVHSGMVRWAKPKSLPDVLDGAVSEAEMARSKAEIAIRHAKAARKAALKDRLLCTNNEPSLPAADPDRSLWDASLAHKAAAAREAEEAARAAARAAADGGGSDDDGAAGLNISEFERLLAEALAESPPDCGAAIEAYGGILACHFEAAALEKVGSVAEDMLRVATRGCSLRGQAAAQEALGTLSYSRCEFDEALEMYSESLRLAKATVGVVGEGTREEKLRLQAVAYGNIGNTYTRMGLHAEALAAAKRAVALAVAAADPRLERQALGNVRRAKEALRPSEAANPAAMLLLTRMPGGATSRDQDQRQCFPVPGAGVLRERKPPYAVKPSG